MENLKNPRKLQIFEVLNFKDIKRGLFALKRQKSLLKYACTNVFDVICLSFRLINGDQIVNVIFCL